MRAIGDFSVSKQAAGKALLKRYQWYAADWGVPSDDATSAAQGRKEMLQENFHLWYTGSGNLLSFKEIAAFLFCLEWAVLVETGLNTASAKGKIRLWKPGLKWPKFSNRVNVDK